jgi:hypothetical protein
MHVTTTHFIPLPLVIAGHITDRLAEDVHIEAEWFYRPGGVAFFDRRSESWVPPEPADLDLHAIRVDACGVLCDVPPGPDFDRIAAALGQREAQVIEQADNAIADAAMGRAA